GFGIGQGRIARTHQEAGGTAFICGAAGLLMCHGRVVLSRQPPSNNTRPPSSNTRRLRTVRGLRSVLLVLVAVLLVIVGLVVLLLVLLVVLGVFLLLLALGHADDDERIRRFRLGRLRVL